MTRQEKLEEIYNLSRKRVELIHEDTQLSDKSYTYNNEFDLDLFLKCAKEYGAEIRPAKPGHGGIYVNGKKITKAKPSLENFSKKLCLDVSKIFKGVIF